MTDSYPRDIFKLSDICFLTQPIIVMVSHYYPINPHMSVSSTVQRDRGHNRHVQVMRPAQPMCRSNSRSPPPPITTTKTTSNSVVYAQQQLGVSLSEGLEKAYSECKAKVERIAAQCRLKNRKFRYKLLLCFFPYPWPNTHCTQLTETFSSQRCRIRSRKRRKPLST